MPTVRHACSTPGCPNHAGRSGGRCGDCAGKVARGNPTASARGYGASWTRVRARFLARSNNLACRLCEGLATIADHWPTSRRDLVAQGVRNPDAEHRLRPLCDPCHKRETARLQPGGWNRR